MQNLCCAACFHLLFILTHQRPAEIVDEEEDGEKANKDAEQKEDFSGMNGEVEEGGDLEATEASEEVEEVPDHREEPAGPTRGNGGTDEENGEELDQVTTELQEAVDEDVKSQGAGTGQNEVILLLLLPGVHARMCVWCACPGT